MNDAFGTPQTLLLLGGTSEIGLAITRRLLARGVQRVVLAGRDRERLDRAAVSLGPIPALETLTFDARDPAGHGAVVDTAFDGGDVDCVVLAVGVLGDQEACEADPLEAVAVAETNYVGAMSLGLHVARRLRAQGHGTLVVLSSVAGERARRANFVYGSSKAGLDAFAQGLGDALVGSGASVLVVRPGFVRTRMTAGRPEAPLAVDPDDVAVAVVRALERGVHTVWVPGVLRWVMAVARHLPRPLFRLWRG